jgi:hypothetical protein
MGNDALSLMGRPAPFRKGAGDSSPAFTPSGKDGQAAPHRNRVELLQKMVLFLKPLLYPIEDQVNRARVLHPDCVSRTCSQCAVRCFAKTCLNPLSWVGKEADFREHIARRHGRKSGNVTP